MHQRRWLSGQWLGGALALAALAVTAVGCGGGGSSNPDNPTPSPSPSPQPTSSPTPSPSPSPTPGPFAPVPGRVVTDPATGHLYQRYTATGTWTQARDYAASLTRDGKPGHLATITSADENAFLLGALGNELRGMFLGGYQDPGSPASDNWHWITGEPWSYTNWAPVPTQEPNDFNGLLEDYLQISEQDESLSIAGWNDVTLLVSNATSGFLVEFDLPTAPPANN